jgi:hypothetical protein
MSPCGLFAASSWWEPQWWRDNGAMVQGLTTGALALITLAYVLATVAYAFITWRILRSQRASQRLAEKTLRENVRAWLSMQTAAVTVEVTPFGYRSGDAAFTNSTVHRRDDTLQTVSHRITIKNHGPGPALVVAEEATVGKIVPMGIGADVGPVGSLDTELLLEAGEESLLASWSFEQTGERFHADWTDKTISHTFRSRSPVTGVKDTHTWSGSFKLVEPVGGVGDQPLRLDGPRVAAIRRRFPGDPLPDETGAPGPDTFGGP